MAFVGLTGPANNRKCKKMHHFHQIHPGYRALLLYLTAVTYASADRQTKHLKQKTRSVEKLSKKDMQAHLYKMVRRISTHNLRDTFSTTRTLSAIYVLLFNRQLLK